MASPVADSYQSASGASVYAGRYSRPAWRRAMSIHEWASISNNTLSSVDPKSNPALNPNYPNTPEWGATSGQAGLFAWTGGCYDEINDVLWIPLGGGHADYAGNEPYRIRIRDESPAWEMVRPPSGAIGNLLTTNDGQEATGNYADGRPRAIHSYNKPIYIPDVGPAIAVQGHTSHSGQNGPLRHIRLDPDTGEATYGGTISGSSSASGGGACYDSLRNEIVWRGAGTEPFRRYSLASDTWSDIANTSMSAWAETSLTYLPDHDCILWINTAVSNSIRVLDCSTNTLHSPTVTGVPVGTALNGKLQPRWYAPIGGCVAWNNATSLGAVTTFDFSDPRTEIVIGSISATSGAPTASNGTGTYGRFFASEILGGCGVINAITGAVYFFALD